MNLTRKIFCCHIINPSRHTSRVERVKNDYRTGLRTSRAKSRVGFGVTNIYVSSTSHIRESKVDVSGTAVFLTTFRRRIHLTPGHRLIGSYVRAIQSLQEEEHMVLPGWR